MPRSVLYRLGYLSIALAVGVPCVASGWNSGAYIPLQDPDSAPPAVVHQQAVWLADAQRDVHVALAAGAVLLVAGVALLVAASRAPLRPPVPGAPGKGAKS